MTSGSPRTLVIVERAHRGALEEQFADVLWLVRTLRRLSPLTLLLRGTAAVYAVDRPAAHRETMLSLAGQGGALFVAASSLIELGLTDQPLLPAVRALSDREVTAEWVSHDRIWFL